MNTTQSATVVLSAITLLVTSLSLYKTYDIQKEVSEVTSRQNVVLIHCPSIKDKSEILEIKCKEIAAREIERVSDLGKKIANSNDEDFISGALREISRIISYNRALDWSGQVNKLNKLPQREVAEYINNDPVMSSYIIVE
jgi:hypothetical protein